MKVQRYFAAQTTVGQLREARRSLLSPYQAAQGAAAGARGLAKIASSLSQDLMEVQQYQQQLDAQQDERTAKVMEKQLQLAESQFLNDPRWKEHTQPDGTPTPTAMREEWSEVSASLRETMSQFNSERARSEFDELYTLGEQAAMIDIERAIAAKRNQIDSDTLLALESVAIENKDYNYARQVITEREEKGYITEAQARQAKARLDRQINTDTRNTIVDGFYDALAQGEEQAEAYYEQVRSNPQKDAALQAGIMSSLNAAMANYEKSKQKENAWNQATALREASDAIRMARAGEVVDTQAVFERQLELLDDPVAAMRTVLTIEDAQARAGEQNAEYAQFLLQAQNGIPTMANAANRKMLDQFLLDSGEMEQAASGSELNQAKGEIYRQFGYVGESDRILLKTGVNSAEGLARMAPLVDELTSDPLRQVDMGLSAKEQGIYEAVVARYRNGMTWEEAAQFQLELMQVDGEELERRESLWNKGGLPGVMVDDDAEGYADGPSIAREYYDTMLAETDTVSGGLRVGGLKFFSPFGFFPSGIEWGEKVVPGVNDGSEDSQLSLLRYQKALKDGLLLHGNYEDARRHANLTWQKSHGFNNINGEWRVQHNGLNGDSKAIRTNALNMIRDEEYLVGLGNGTYDTMPVRQLEQDQISFVDPEKTDAGIKYSLYYKDLPVMDPATQKVKEVLIEQEDMAQAAVSQSVKARRKELKDQIARTRAEIEEANRKLALGDDSYDFPDKARAFVTGRPQLPADPSDVIRTGESRIQRLQDELDKLDGGEP